MCNQQLSSEISGLNNEVFRLQRKMEEIESSREFGHGRDRVSSPTVDPTKIIRPMRCITEEIAAPAPPRRAFAETPTGGSSGLYGKTRGPTAGLLELDRDFSESRVIIREPEVDSILRYIESIEFKLDDASNENRDLLKYFWNERFASSTNLIRLLDSGKYLQALVNSFKLLNDFVTLSAHMTKKHDSDLMYEERHISHMNKRPAAFDIYNTPNVPGQYPLYKDQAPYFIQPAAEQIPPLRDRSNSPFERSEAHSSNNQHAYMHQGQPALTSHDKSYQHSHQHQPKPVACITCSTCQEHATDTSSMRVGHQPYDQLPAAGRRTPSPIQNHPDRSQTHSMILPAKPAATREVSPGRSTRHPIVQRPLHREAQTGKYATSPRRIQQQRSATPSPPRGPKECANEEECEYAETKDALAALRSNIQALNRSINSKIGPVAPGMRHSEYPGGAAGQTEMDEVHMAASPKQALNNSGLPMNTSVLSRDLNPKSESVLVFDHLRRAQAQSGHALNTGGHVSPHRQHPHQSEVIIEEEYPVQATGGKGKNFAMTHAASTGKKNAEDKRATGWVSPKPTRFSHGRVESNESGLRSGSASRSSKLVKKSVGSATKPKYNGKTISNAPERVLHLEDIPRRKKCTNATVQSSGVFYDIISGATGKETRLSMGGKEGAERDVSPGPAAEELIPPSPHGQDTGEKQDGDVSPERDDDESSSPEFSKVIAPAPASTKHSKSIKKPMKSTT
jgi:hypothetical protein